MSNENPTKIIIHNVTDLSDEMFLRMVLQVVNKGRMYGTYKNHTRFKGNYEVRCKSSCHKYPTDTFWITEKNYER